MCHHRNFHCSLPLLGVFGNLCTIERLLLPVIIGGILEYVLLSRQHMNIHYRNFGCLRYCRKDLGIPCHYFCNIWMRVNIGILVIPSLLGVVLEFVPLSGQHACVNILFFSSFLGISLDMCQYRSRLFYAFVANNLEFALLSRRYVDVPS